MKQCKNCWMFGHKQEACRKKKKCGSCGNEHDEAECTEPIKCLNCGEEHPSNDKSCSERDRHKKVNEAVQRRRITYQEAMALFPKPNPKQDSRNENQFDLLGRFDEFPNLNQEGHERTNYWTGRQKFQRTGRNSQRKGYWRRRRNSEAAASEVSTGTYDSPGCKAEIGKLAQKVEELGRKMNVVGRIIKLQQCVEEETKQEQDAVSLEALVIKISTVLNEIVAEFGKTITEAESRSENHSETEKQSNNKNGQ